MTEVDWFKVVDFFLNCKADLIAEDLYDERSEDSIYYEAVDMTCEHFEITEDEFYKYLKLKERQK